MVIMQQIHFGWGSSSDLSDRAHSVPQTSRLIRIEPPHGGEGRRKGHGKKAV